MTFNHFLENHWDLFVRHICLYHPLSMDFIETYAHETAEIRVVRRR